MFWFIAFLLAWALTAPMAAHQLGYLDLRLPFPLAFGVGLAPVIAAFIAAPFDKRLRELIGNVTRFSAPWWTYVLALAFPLLFAAAPFIAAQIQNTSAPTLDLSTQTAMFGALWFVLAWGEEIGWRGYALPRLVQRFGFLIASTILGLVWAVWHYPRLLASPYVSSLEQALPFLGLFTLQIMFANYIICWLTARARYAVIIPALFHTGFNIFSTALPTASIDTSVTIAIGACALVVLLIGGVKRDTPA
jgi:uncharacterized protein